jgi:hypothetical protein
MTAAIALLAVFLLQVVPMPSQADDSSLSFDYTETIYLAYNKEKDRSTMLDRLRVIWEQTLNKYQASHVKVMFVSEKRSVGVQTADEGGQALNEVTYRLTGFAPIRFNIDEVRPLFEQRVHDAHLGGVSFTLASSSGSDNSNSNSDQMQQIDFSDSLLLTYTSSSERDSLLQQILTIWRNVLNSFHIITLDIQFLSEEAGDFVDVNTKTVTYRLTGQSTDTIDFQSLLSTFHQALLDTPINGVQLVSDVAGSIKQTSSAALPFDYTQTIYLAYNKEKDRSTMLDRLRVIWEQTLNQYQASQVKVMFVSEKRSVGVQSAEEGGQALNQVTYRLTGSSSISFDINEVQPIFEQSVHEAHLGGVSFTLASSSGSDIRNSNSAPASSASEVEDTVRMTYKTVTQRNSMLQQVMELWKEVLVKLHVSNVKITFLKETPTSEADVKRISYRVTFSTQQSFDSSVYLSTFHQQLQKTHLIGIQVSSSEDSNADNSMESESSMQSGNMQSSEGNGQGSSVLDISKPIVLTYKSNAERDNLLQQILTSWKSALGGADVQNLKISFVDAKPMSVGHHTSQVTYRITGSASSSADVSSVTTTNFFRTLQSQLLNDSAGNTMSQQSFSFST